MSRRGPNDADQRYQPVELGPRNAGTPPPSNLLRPGMSKYGRSQSDVEMSSPYPQDHRVRIDPPSSSSNVKPQYPPTPVDVHGTPVNSKRGSWFGVQSNTGSDDYLQFADGDLPKPVRGYFSLIGRNIVLRWVFFIIPVLGICWVPGILSLTLLPNAQIWHVGFFWWSVWLSVVWAGWWVALAFASLIPFILRWTIGLAALSLRIYIEWIRYLRRYIAIAGWSVALFASWHPLIENRLSPTSAASFPSSAAVLSLIGRMAAGVMISAYVLLGEKFFIQFIAWKFHERSYADRIAAQKIHTRYLIILYQHSKDIVDRGDILHDPNGKNGPAMNPAKFLKRAFKGVADTTTIAFGSLASEIAGTAVLQPNSPAGIVSTSLSSANKSRLLARRIFYSYRQPGADHLVLDDIARYFPNREQALSALAMFDRDENGDVTRDEIEAACLEMHHERLALVCSMKDIDSAVSRLDNIFMAIYAVIVLLIFAVTLDAQLTSILTGAGTFILGLSWLIGGSAAEVLTSIIFLLIKHPFDIADVIQIDNETYVVKEIMLLSTVLVDSRGCSIQAPNSILNTKFIMNMRRSDQMSEPFAFEVAYSTSFDQIEKLRARMLQFLTTNSRDYLPVFDVSVTDIPDQQKMVLNAAIKYKSNWQVAALKAQRRNKWVCALKEALAAAKVFGPSGDPTPAANGPQEVTLVPWEEVQKRSHHQDDGGSSPDPPLSTSRSWQFADKKNAYLDRAGDVFGESSELNMPNPRSATRPTPSPRPSNISQRSATQDARNRQAAAADVIMMSQPPPGSAI